jgi:DNA-binding GntR family transcriptional regulator
MDRTAKPTGAQLVYQALRRAVIALELEPGASLEEETLCRQFKMSRTPVREALIRLASEGLAELSPNRGARVAPLQFADVVDHYEAMDVFMPIVCHFAAVRRTAQDLAAAKRALAAFQAAVRRRDLQEIVQHNHDLHAAIAAAAHNRCIERGYRQMLVDKLRLAQHALSGDRERGLARRFVGTARISARLVRAIEKGAGREAERLGRELNTFVRRQVIGVLSESLAHEIELRRPAARR